MKSTDLYSGITSSIQGIEKLKKELELEYVESKPRDTIYHYTNADGLLGIIQNKNLWCTDIEFMNDADELNYAKELIKLRLDEFGKENQTDTVFLNLLEENLYKAFREAYNIHIFCFSEEKDISNQWSSYGNYCIGFDCKTPFKTDKHSNMASFSSSWQTARFRKVIYSRKKQVAIIDKIISTFYELFKTRLKTVDLEKQKLAYNFSIDFSELIFQFLIMFKNESFRYEKEWRLIHLIWKDRQSSLGMNERDVKFRPVNDHLRPYVKSAIRVFDKDKESGIYRKEYEDSEMYKNDRFNFDDYMKEAGKFPINYVGIGPLTHLDIAIDSVQRVLKIYGFEEAKVSMTTSNIRTEF